MPRSIPSPGHGWAIRAVIAGLAAAAFGAPAMAQEPKDGVIVQSVTVAPVDLHPHSAAEARRLLDRLSDAAIEACGGSASSLREVKAAIRASSCWRQSLSDVVYRIGDRRLIDQYDHSAPLNAAR